MIRLRSPLYCYTLYQKGSIYGSKGVSEPSLLFDTLVRMTNAYNNSNVGGNAFAIFSDRPKRTGKPKGFDASIYKTKEERQAYINERVKYRLGRIKGKFPKYYDKLKYLLDNNKIIYQESPYILLGKKIVSQNLVLLLLEENMVV